MNDLSIDIETLGTASNAAVLSIGAVFFDRATGEIRKSFYTQIDLAWSLSSGAVSADTLRWWMQQNAEARRVFEPGGVDAPTACQQFVSFVQTGAQRSHDAIPWGNGASFDVSILETLLARYGFAAPWRFWNIRDMRTLMEAAELAGFSRDQIAFQGTAHNALDDAQHQARCISAAWQQLQSALGH